jgi:hypothetical protein
MKNDYSKINGNGLLVQKENMKTLRSLPFKTNILGARLVHVGGPMLVHRSLKSGPDGTRRCTPRSAARRWTKPDKVGQKRTCSTSTPPGAVTSRSKDENTSHAVQSRAAGPPTVCGHILSPYRGRSPPTGKRILSTRQTPGYRRPGRGGT